MARAANMQALTNDVKRQWPGVVVYGIGDTAHKARASDHNEDDTSGSKAAQSDPDGRAEHRAIDIMLGKAFTKADADALVARLVADPKARARLFYIIWDGYIWSRSNGWKKTKYTGSDQHTDHIHGSGWAADDENTATWPAVAVKTLEAPDMTPDESRMLRNADRLVSALISGETQVTGFEWPAGTKKTYPLPLAKQVAETRTMVAALAGKDFTDEPAIVKGVLAGLDATAIAAAIPPTMAKQVADELTRRLAA